LWRGGLYRCANGWPEYRAALQLFLLSHAGAVVVSAPLSGITVTKGEDKLTEYRFNTGTARHFFCSVCGIYTFHQRRSNPNEYGVNVACFDNVSPFDFPEVTVMDGVNHPSDGDSGVFGYLFSQERNRSGVIAAWPLCN
jgi:hypothetical protein